MRLSRIQWACIGLFLGGLLCGADILSPSPLARTISQVDLEEGLIREVKPGVLQLQDLELSPTFSGERLIGKRLVQARNEWRAFPFVFEHKGEFRPISKVFQSEHQTLHGVLETVRRMDSTITYKHRWWRDPRIYPVICIGMPAAVLFVLAPYLGRGSMGEEIVLEGLQDGSVPSVGGDQNSTEVEDISEPLTAQNDIAVQSEDNVTKDEKQYAGEFYPTSAHASEAKH